MPLLRSLDAAHSTGSLGAACKSQDAALRRTLRTIVSKCRVINSEHRANLKSLNQEWRCATLMDQNFEFVYNHMKPLETVEPEAILGMYEYRKEEKQKDEIEALNAVLEYKNSLQDTKRAVAKFEYESLKKNKRDLIMKKKSKLE